MKATVGMKGNLVEIKVEFRSGYAGEYTWIFTHDTGNPAYSGLAAETLCEQFNSHMRQVRSEAYEKGWRDAKARRAKCTWFSGGWT